MKKPTDIGPNRTGVGTSPLDSKELVEGAQSSTPSSSGDASQIQQLRMSYTADASPVGTMPPPSSVKGVVGAVIGGITKNPEVFLDKLGERLSFERGGTRLYEALLAKLDALGSWDGGPARSDLDAFHNEELRHFHLVKRAMESLGADPTAATPSADIAGVEAQGILQVITDPRTTLPQALHALLVAELTDREGWDSLVKLADDFGHETLADDFRNALREEENHLTRVRHWVTDFTSRSAQGHIEIAA